MESKGRLELPLNYVMQNEIRNKIVEAVSDTPLSIVQIEKKLNINRGTLKHHLKILTRNNILKKTKLEDAAGKPVLYSVSIDQEKIKKFTLELLQTIEKEGEIPFEQFMTSPDLYFGCKDYKEKSRANNFLLYSQPKLIQRCVKLTLAGKKFLEENN